MKDIKPFKWDNTQNQQDDLELLYSYIYGFIVENFNLSFLERLALRAVLGIIMRRLRSTKIKNLIRKLEESSPGEAGAGQEK